VAATPKIRYARSSGGVRIAYQVMGDGPNEVVFVTGFVGNVESTWDEPLLTHFFERIGRFARVAVFDKRGQGLSDRPADPPTLEQTTDDIQAVMEASGFESATLLGISEGGPATILFAASHPERVNKLVLYGTYARLVDGPGYTAGLPVELLDGFVGVIDRSWGGPVGAELFAPPAAADPAFRDFWARFLRRGTSPQGAMALLGLYRELDVRHVLPTITAPTLVLHRVDDVLAPLAVGRYLGDHIAGARLVELSGADHLVYVDSDQILDEVEEFLTGERHVREPDRVLATVMFTDIVGSTERAAQLGDGRWRELVARHDDLVRRQLERHRGRAIKTLGDGFLATFDGPARGIRCAQAIGDGVRQLGIEIRAGLHTGELELTGDDVAGMAVNIGARVSALAGAGEVLVSSTVKDLVVGSGIEFAERGEHQLKGVPGCWRLYAAGA
jgi:class 3 adenylate cyclase/predicted alpha/beta hydrolase